LGFCSGELHRYIWGEEYKHEKELEKLREKQDKIDELMIQGIIYEETYKRKTDRAKMILNELIKLGLTYKYESGDRFYYSTNTS